MTACEGYTDTAPLKLSGLGTEDTFTGWACYSQDGEHVSYHAHIAPLDGGPSELLSQGHFWTQGAVDVIYMRFSLT